jgi:hypothetical protein
MNQGAQHLLRKQPEFARIILAMLGLLLFVAVCRSFSKAAPDGVPAERPVFDADIEPLVRAKCQRCHGEKARKADLDLRTHMSIQKGGESGPVVTAGNPEKSLLYEKVRDGVMPPGKQAAPARPARRPLRSTMSSPFCSAAARSVMDHVCVKAGSICGRRQLCFVAGSQGLQLCRANPRPA